MKMGGPLSELSMHCSCAFKYSGDTEMEHGGQKCLQHMKLK